MAVPPTIPTSFVPKQPVDMRPRRYESGVNVFMIGGLAILGIAAFLAVAVFAYSHYLDGQVSAKGAQLQKVESGVSEDSVDSLLRFQSRLANAENVLSNHVTLSQFFDTLESLTLSDVRFTNLTLTVADDHSANVELEGKAQDFNALAAQSAAFAASPLVHQAIFSGISADTTGAVTFSLGAVLDPKLVNIGATVPASWASGAQAPSSTSP